MATESLIDQIHLDVHPSCCGLPNDRVIVRRNGDRREWQPRYLTRLCLPGGLFIDYDTNLEAINAKGRLLAILGTAADPKVAIDQFFFAE